MNAERDEYASANPPLDEPCPEDTLLHELIEGVLADAERARIAAHLDRCADCRSTVSALAKLDQPEPRPEAAPIEATAWEPGTELCRYRLSEPLGRGSMGQVYAAQDLELGREVAIKRLLFPPWAPEDERRAAGVAEARALAQLDHPNVVRVYEVAMLAGWPCVVMERIHGQSLRRFQETARPGLAELLAIYKQAAAGLSAVHARGLVHRDFKPDNVLVDASGRVKIVDFGLARAQPGSPAGGSTSTGEASRASSRAGTPGYMAPEQLAGHKASAASDQFAFCVSLVESLSGRRPFASGDREALPAAMTEDLPVEWMRALPRRLRGPVRKGLSRDPAQRLASMAEWVRILDAVADGGRVGWWYAGAVLLLAIGLVVIGSRFHKKPDPCSRAAVEAAQDLRRDLAALRRAAEPAGRAMIFLQSIDQWTSRFFEERKKSCETEPQLARLTCLDGEAREVRGVLAEAAALSAAERAGLGEVSFVDPRLCALAAAPTVMSVDPVRAQLRWRLRLELARLSGLLARGRRAAVAGAVDASLGRAEALGDPAVVVEALILAGLAGGQGEKPLQRAAELASHYGLFRQARHAAALLSVELERSHRAAEADTWLARALQRNGAFLNEPDGVSIWAEGMLLGLRGRHHEAAAQLERAAKLIEAEKGAESPLLSSSVLPALAKLKLALGEPDAFAQIERARRIAASYATESDPVLIVIDQLALLASRGDSLATRQARLSRLRSRAEQAGEKELLATLDEGLAELAEAAGDVALAAVMRRKSVSNTDERTRLSFLLWRLRRLAESLVRAGRAVEAWETLERERALRERQSSFTELLTDRQYVSLIAMYRALPRKELSGRAIPTLPVTSSKVVRIVDGTAQTVLDAVRACFSRPGHPDLCTESDAWGLVSVPDALKGDVRVRLDHRGYYPALLQLRAGARMDAATFRLFPAAMATAIVSSLGLRTDPGTGWLLAGAESESGAGVAGVRLELEPASSAGPFYLNERGVFERGLAATSINSRDGALFGLLPPGVYRLTAKLGPRLCQRSITIPVEEGRLTLVPDFLCPQPEPLRGAQARP